MLIFADQVCTANIDNKFIIACMLQKGCYSMKIKTVLLRKFIPWKYTRYTVSHDCTHTYLNKRVFEGGSAQSNSCFLKRLDTAF